MNRVDPAGRPSRVTGFEVGRRPKPFRVLGGALLGALVGYVIAFTPLGSVVAGAIAGAVAIALLAPSVRVRPLRNTPGTHGISGGDGAGVPSKPLGGPPTRTIGAAATPTAE